MDKPIQSSTPWCPRASDCFYNTVCRPRDTRFNQSKVLTTRSELKWFASFDPQKLEQVR